MAAKFKISEEVRSVISRSAIDGFTLKLPEQLSPSLYADVMKVIKGAGGKWSKPRLCHVFESDPAVLLGVAVDTGVAVNMQQASQSFYTPPEVVEIIHSHAKVAAGNGKMDIGSTILEPSAGHGALVKKFAGTNLITAVELGADQCNVLRDMGISRVHNGDFLLTSPGTKGKLGLGLYSRILMNPPFSGGQAIRHVSHALDFLKEGGILVSVMPAGWETSSVNRNRALLSTLNDPMYSYSVFPLPDESFKESGTKVATSLLVVES